MVEEWVPEVFDHDEEFGAVRDYRAFVHRVRFVVHSIEGYCMCLIHSNKFNLTSEQKDPIFQCKWEIGV